MTSLQRRQAGSLAKVESLTDRLCFQVTIHANPIADAQLAGR